MICQICQSKKFKIIRKKLRYDIKRNVWQCSKCGLVFLEPVKKTVGYYRGKQYRQHYGPDLKRQSSCREIFNAYLPAQAAIIKEIKKVIRPASSVLDVGCSTGHFLHALKDKVGQRVGIELDQAAVKFIRRNLGFKVYDKPIENLKIAEAPFDLVTSLQVLEHVDDPLLFLRQIAKNIKPKGYLYLEVPNLEDALLSVYKISGYADFYFREPHLFYFSVATFKKLLTKAGFVGRVKTVQRYNVLNHLSWRLTGQPQASFGLGFGAPQLVNAKKANRPAARELNKFIEKVDTEYKKLLIKYNLGESISFIGQRIK